MLALGMLIEPITSTKNKTLPIGRERKDLDVHK